MGGMIRAMTQAQPRPAGIMTGDSPPPEEGPSTIVELAQVSKSFGPNHVLKNIDLSFPQGRTTVVLGPSGAGKSVILKHIAGLMQPDSGQVLFRGNRIDHLPERDLTPFRKEMGFLFQQSALFDSMTVLENLEFPLIEHTRLSARERRKRAIEALETVDLHDVEAKVPSELSGGQQKRVALARAIILKPTLILYDEPTTGLDPVRADGINELINKLRRLTSVTGIVVTHDLACMRKVADRVVMLYEGVIRFEGSPRDIESAQDPIVKRFIEVAAEHEHIQRLTQQSEGRP